MGVSDFGLQGIAQAVGDGNSFVAWGSGTTPFANTDTDLDAPHVGNGLGRVAMTIDTTTTTITGDTTRWRGNHTATANAVVEEVAIFKEATGANAIVRQLTGTINIRDGDQLWSENLMIHERV